MGNIRLRVCAIIVKDGKLLTVKHDDYPFYYLVGGGLEFDETTEQAVIREVFEETGYKLEVDRLAIFSEDFFIPNYSDGHSKGQKQHELDFFYVMKGCDVIDITDKTPTDQQTESLHWLPIDDLEQFNLVPPYLKTALKKLNDTKEISHIVRIEV